jgi:hypothetical protein
LPTMLRNTACKPSIKTLVKGTFTCGFKRRKYGEFLRA